ncbi:hypothetical protein [Photobacterium damselae]|uniref:hypothetical protein n=1 Tax=Photobacterium damselae TaxID=38293 RepID=UPI001F183D97|nr:hypothetical protein [Photobacterium damselae]UKA04790.1 hypothetical protein IHC89_21345 [Photobacterium damselae subsp. damselae]
MKTTTSLPSTILKSNVFSSELMILSYNGSTVSSILIECPNNKKAEASPIIIANECDDFFQMADDLIDQEKAKQKCKAYEIAPFDVCEILQDAEIEHTYDTLGAFELIKAFNANRPKFLYLATRTQ